MDSDKTVYSFTPKSGVSMAWVRVEHVDALLKVRAHLCCGREGNKFKLATIGQVAAFETGGRPTEEVVREFSVT